MKQEQNVAVYKERRQQLVHSIKERYPDKQGIIILFAGFESRGTVFRQESSFYYLTGIREPGVVLVMDLSGQTDLYIPQCDQERAKWMIMHTPLIQSNAGLLGVNRIHYLGQLCNGYQFHPFFAQKEYENLLQLIQQISARKGVIFTLTPDNQHEYTEQRLLLERIKQLEPTLTAQQLIDISPFVAHMRRQKDQEEITALYKAVEITALAQEAACQALADGVKEAEVQASLEYMFTASGARAAFPSIVGGGRNSTVLHYHESSSTLKNGDVVVIDIGAEYDYYCADITRTYPVSGTFTKRQKEIYNLVLATQEYVASKARPGMWLSNKEKPDQSLNHLARKYLQERGYDKYFLHGIGHFLGLDVHDVGDYSKPLQEGDVITIEPGIYIAAENIGVRIEDDYWIVPDGAICLSEDIPKKAEDIEAMVQQRELPQDEVAQDDGDDFVDYNEEDEDEVEN